MSFAPPKVTCSYTYDQGCGAGAQAFLDG